MPVLPGHDPEENQDFTTFADAAREIEDFCIRRWGENVHGVYGASMGGVLAATLWQNQRLHFRHVIFDGSPLLSLNPLMHGVMRQFYLNITLKTKHRHEKTLKQAVGTIISQEHLPAFLNVLDHMSDTTITRCLAGIAGFTLAPNIPGNVNIHFFHGTAPNEMLAKASAKYLQKHYPTVTVHCFRGKGHVEDLLFHPENLIRELDRIL